MVDVLLVVGKGGAQAAIDTAAAQVLSELQTLGLSIERVVQDGAASALPTQVQSLVAEHSPRVLISVGFTAGVTLAEVVFSGVSLVPVIPDVPGTASGPYEKVLGQLARVVERSAYLVVLDEVSRSALEQSVAGASGRVLVPESLTPVKELAKPLSPASPTKVLISSHDFRFIADVAAHLGRIPGVEVRLQRWELSAAQPTEDQLREVKWADVVLAEWAGRNAVWFSQNLEPHQRLVVHLHGFEASSEWIDGLKMSRVEQLVVVSDFYRRQLLSEKGWPAEKLRVIPNALETAVYDRPKRDDARFHLAMLGFTPLLKRPDVALEVIKTLVKKDERFMLHLRGKSPWQHDWVWNRQLREADAFAELYASVAQDSSLREHVIFEGYGANVEAWLSGIGWVLSLSERETFHLAAAEGMASGAVPVFLPRAGVEEIFTDRWVLESPQAIADFIYETVNDDMWQRESGVAQAVAARFDVAGVRALWQEVLV